MSVCTKLTALADLRGATGTQPKKLQNNRFLGDGAPPGENPGSATELRWIQDNNNNNNLFLYLYTIVICCSF